MIDEEQELQKLLNNYNLQCSLVSFFAPMIEKYLHGKKAPDVFIRRTINKFNEIKFFYLMMPAEDRKRQHELFQNELVFADNINKIFLKYSMTIYKTKKHTIDFRKEIISEIVRYNKLYEKPVFKRVKRKHKFRK